MAEEKIRKILDTFADTLPKLDDSEVRYLEAFGDGMAVLAKKREEKKDEEKTAVGAAEA